MVFLSFVVERLLSSFAFLFWDKHKAGREKRPT